MGKGKKMLWYPWLAVNTSMQWKLCTGHQGACKDRLRRREIATARKSASILLPFFFLLHLCYRLVLIFLFNLLFQKATWGGWFAWQLRYSSILLIIISISLLCFLYIFFYWFCVSSGGVSKFFVGSLIFCFLYVVDSWLRSFIYYFEVILDMGTT